jgi:hypothetical protein
MKAKTPPLLLLTKWGKARKRNRQNTTGLDEGKILLGFRDAGR